MNLNPDQPDHPLYLIQTSLPFFLRNPWGHNMNSGPAHLICGIIFLHEPHLGGAYAMWTLGQQ